MVRGRPGRLYFLLILTGDQKNTIPYMYYINTGGGGKARKGREYPRVAGGMGCHTSRSGAVVVV